jgi:hypothetical protein
VTVPLRMSTALASGTGGDNCKPMQGVRDAVGRAVVETCRGSGTPLPTAVAPHTPCTLNTGGYLVTVFCKAPLHTLEPFCPALLAQMLLGCLGARHLVLDASNKGLHKGWIPSARNKWRSRA